MVLSEVLVLNGHSHYLSHNVSLSSIDSPNRYWLRETLKVTEPIALKISRSDSTSRLATRLSHALQMSINSFESEPNLCQHHLIDLKWLVLISIKYWIQILYWVMMHGDLFCSKAYLMHGQYNLWRPFHIKQAEVQKGHHISYWLSTKLDHASYWTEFQLQWYSSQISLSVKLKLVLHESLVKLIK